MHNILYSWYHELSNVFFNKSCNLKIFPYNKARVIIFILWFILWDSCVWMLIRSIFFLNNENKIFDIVTFSICVVALLFVLIYVATEVKIDPMPIFDCIELTKVEFNELAQHFDNAVKIMLETYHNP